MYMILTPTKHLVHYCFLHICQHINQHCYINISVINQYQPIRLALITYRSSSIRHTQTPPPAHTHSLSFSALPLFFSLSTRQILCVYSSH